MVTRDNYGCSIMMYIYRHIISQCIILKWTCERPYLYRIYIYIDKIVSFHYSSDFHICTAYMNNGVYKYSRYLLLSRWVFEFQFYGQRGTKLPYHIVSHHIYTSACIQCSSITKWPSLEPMATFYIRGSKLNVSRDKHSDNVLDTPTATVVIT